MLAFDNLTKRFGANIAVDNVCVSIDRPMMVGIIGASGAGKSTLLRIINRLTDATSGKLEFEGRDVLGLKGTAKRAWQSQCAMIFQQFNLVPRMDVVSNVLHGTLNRRSSLATMFNLYPTADIHKAIAILDRLGIAEHAPKRAEALSGGQQQRVAIARLMVQRPRVMLADEPVSQLDLRLGREIIGLLAGIARQMDATLLVNLHTLELLHEHFDRVIALREGRLFWEGTPKGISRDLLRDLYGAEYRALSLDEVTLDRPVPPSTGDPTG